MPTVDSGPIPAGPPLLAIESLGTWIDSGDRTLRAIDGLSLDVGRGECVALVGESGCGKSMTALSVMRLLPDAGEIVSGHVRFDGEDLTAMPEAAVRDIRGRRIAMIFQEPMLSLNPVMSVGRQIGEAIERHTGLRGAQAMDRAIELLGAVGIPDPARRLDEYPFQFSGGMKQRVMIAIALACDPELLIADEPTTALDVTIQAQILDLLRTLQASRGMSLLLITHDLAVVAGMAQRVAVMYAGEVVEIAGCDAFFAAPAHPYSRKLFDSLPRRASREEGLAVIRGQVPQLDRLFSGCRFVDRCDHAIDVCRNQPPPLEATSEGHAVRCHRAGEPELSVPVQASIDAGRGVAPSGNGPPLLSVTGLQVHFPIRKGLFRRVHGHVKAVDGVSLEVGRGRTLAMVGESGCGKTTVGKGILRLLPVTGGRVEFDGVDLSGLSAGELRARRRDMQIVFQDPYSSLDPRMRVADILSEGMAALGVGDSEAARQQRIDALLGEVGLSPAVKWRHPHEFSGGQRQRIAIARALAVEPRLIVCDEPTSALDVSVQAQILNLLRDLQHRRGLSYLFITHNMSVVEFLAHDVAVMYLGRVVEHGPVDAVFGNPQHPYTRALLSSVPTLDRKPGATSTRLAGEMPSPANPPRGCHFHPRCAEADEACRERYPDARILASTVSVACHHRHG